jgi:hypothetical protein
VRSKILTHVHDFNGNGGHFENSKTWVHLLRWGSDHQSLRIWSDKFTARRRRGIIIIIIIRKNGAKTISLQTLFGDLIRNGANTICLPNFAWWT